MSAFLAENQTLVRRYREELWNGKLEAADEISDPAIRLHIIDPITPDFGAGPQALKQLVTLYNAAFPDVHHVIEDLVVEETKATVRWQAQGTHQGALGEIAPTGKHVKVTGIDLYHLRDGKITDVWASWDALGMMQQLGLSS